MAAGTFKAGTLPAHASSENSRAYRQPENSYRMLGLVKDAFPYRTPGPHFGRYGSLVLVAPCNFACNYCDVGGYDKDEQNNLPGWSVIPTSEIESFVEEQVEHGSVIYFSGGEPLMFPELIFHLAKKVRQLGGYSVVCTNATYGQRMMALSSVVDEFSISLKGRPGLAEQISGVSGRLAFDLPYQNTFELMGLTAALEFVVVMFQGLTAADIDAIYHPFFGRAQIVLKEYRPKVTRANSDHTYSTELITGPGGRTGPMPPDEMRRVFAELVRGAPEHAGSFRLVMGGGGDQVVVTPDREHRFSR